MKPFTLGVMGAMSSLVALPGSALAASPAVPRATSYAQLLEPIPDAAARLQTADLDESQSGVRLIPAAWRYRWVRERVYYRHRYYRRHYYYGYRYAVPIYPFLYYHHHHHHHHHHHSFY